MATLVDVVETVNQLTTALNAASDSTSKLLRETGSFVEIAREIEGPGRLSLTRPEPIFPTIDSGRSESLLRGFVPGIGISRTFLNYASTFLGFGASGFEESISRSDLTGGG